MTADFDEIMSEALSTARTTTNLVDEYLQQLEDAIDRVLGLVSKMEHPSPDTVVVDMVPMVNCTSLRHAIGSELIHRFAQGRRVT